MSKNVKFAATGMLALGLLGGLIWFSVKAKNDGATCQWCGETIAHEKQLGHNLICKKAPKKMQFDRTGK